MPKTSTTPAVQPNQRAGFIHFYNLEGRHFFSTVFPLTSAANHRAVIAGCLQPANPSSVHVSRKEDDITLEKPLPYSSTSDNLRGSCFSFGPLAGVYLIATDIAHPLIQPHEVAQLWMKTQHGLHDSTSYIRCDKEG